MENTGGKEGRLIRPKALSSEIGTEETRKLCHGMSACCGIVLQKSLALMSGAMFLPGRIDF
jgi:hypothetical protein